MICLKQDKDTEGDEIAQTAYKSLEIGRIYFVVANHSFTFSL